MKPDGETILKVVACKYCDFILKFIKIPRFSANNLKKIASVVRAMKSRRLRSADHVARMEEGRSAFNILTGKPTGKRPLRKPRR